MLSFIGNCFSYAMTNYFYIGAGVFVGLSTLSCIKNLCLVIDSDMNDNGKIKRSFKDLTLMSTGLITVASIFWPLAPVWIPIAIVLYYPLWYMAVKIFCMISAGVFISFMRSNGIIRD